MKTLALLALSLTMVSCMQTLNSSFQDAKTYSVIDGHEGFSESRAIMAQNCAGVCHSFHTMSEKELVAAGVLKLGSAAESKLYYRLANSIEGGGPKNMPSGGSLSVSDLKTIQEWINGAID